LSSNNITGDMPDLPLEDKFVEQRRVIKFWIDHCANLEQDRDKWKRLFVQLYEQNSGVTDEMMHEYRATKKT
jgi:hypothetical protein